MSARVRAFVVVAMLALAACSGGGGGTPTSPSTSAPTTAPSFTPTPFATASGPTATFTPRVAASPALSQFSVQSNPSGLAVTIDASPAGTTPVTLTPAYSVSQHTVTITPNNGAQAFAFIIAQTANGNHTISYNQQFDVFGSIASIATSAVSRAASPSRVSAARADALGEPHFIARSHPAALSATRLAVRYRVSALAMTGRRAEDIERASGVVRAVPIGFDTSGERTRLVDVPAGSSLQALRARLEANPEVLWVAPLQLRYPSSAAQVTPNDTHFDDYQQWDMFAIQSIVKPANYGTFAWGYTLGGNVTIAVIDTGADAHHQDLQGAKITYAEKVVDGTITTGTAAAQDTDGHGTNVAGVAAADTNNGFGFAGTGYNANLQIYRVFADAPTNSLSSNTGDVAQAIYDAVAHGANVINLSFGSSENTGADAVERDAIDYALAHEVTVVAAAGNARTTGVTAIDFPAAYDGVIAVGASALNDSASPDHAQSAVEYVPSYSNIGPQLALVAPGGDANSSTDPDLLHWIYNIYTTTPFDPTQSCKNIADCKAMYTGTSQAAAHVSGAVALMLALNPSLTPAQITQILESTADDIGDPYQGHGRLNVYRALAAVRGDTQGLPGPTYANFRAFAYTAAAGNRPSILDVSYTAGFPVSSSGTYRLADVPASATNFKIGVWDDVNGDGIVDAGDYFGNSPTCLSATVACTGSTSITVHPVAAGFSLP